MKYKIWVDVNLRGTVIATAANVDDAARKARDKVARIVNRAMRVDHRPPTSRPGVWFVMVKVASKRDVANHKKAGRR